MIRAFCAATFLSVIFCLAPASFAQEVTTIEPDTFNYMAEHSLGFVEGYESYQQEIEDRDISFMFSFHTVAPNEFSRFRTRTDFGEADVRPARDTVYLYTSWDSDSDLHGYYADIFVSSLSLKVQHLEIGDTVITEDEKLDWHSRYVAASGGVIFDSGTRIGIGVLTREDPIIVEHDNGTGSFSIITDNESTRTFSSDSTMFAHIVWSFIRYDAVFSNGFSNSSRLRLTAWDYEGTTARLGVNSYKDLLQLGVEFGQKFDRRFDLNLQAFSTVSDERESVRTEKQYGYAVGTIDWYLFRNARPRMPGEPRDFHVVLRYGASYSDYLFAKPVAGEEVRISLRNLRIPWTKTYVDLTVGSSFDYLPYLNYLPLADKQLLYVRISVLR